MSSVVALGRFRLKNVGRPFELYAVTGRRSRRPRADGARGQGRTDRTLPSNLPEAGPPLLGRAVDLAVPRRPRAEASDRHDHRPRRGRQDDRARRARTNACARVPRGRCVRLTRRRGRSDRRAPVARGGARREGSRCEDARRRLVTLIGDTESLLLLDNLEQVVDAAPDLAVLVKRCPALRIVTTSRTPLRIAGEQEYSLAPLPLPPASEIASVESLVAYPSVALFVERATKTKGAFELTPENAVAVAAVCRRLDGLPLALELAAARLRLLSPEALLGAARPCPRRARVGSARHSRTAADIARHHRLEPLAPHGTGAAPVQAAGGLRRRMHGRGRRSRLRRGRRELPRRARVAPRQGARAGRRPGRPARHAADDRGVRS